MLTNSQRAFIAAYAAIGCTSVEGALTATGLLSDDFRQMVGEPEFQQHLHGLFVSMEGQPPPDPFDFTPRPPTTSSFGGFLFSIDPYGPLLGGWAYDHHSKAFTNGQKASGVSPAEVVWYNTAASWASVDKAVKAGPDAGPGG